MEFEIDKKELTPTLIVGILESRLHLKIVRKQSASKLLKKGAFA